MYNNKIKSLYFGIMAVILFTITTGCYSEKEKNRRIPDKEISMIQVNGIKIRANENSLWGDFSTFVESLEEAVPLDNSVKDNVRREENYYVVTLRYNDESKQSFYFFQMDSSGDKWYIETEDGTIYQNADFFAQYFQRTSTVFQAEAISDNELDILEPERLKSIIQLTLQLEDWNISYSLTDLRALFAIEMLNQAENVSPKQEVVQAVRKKLSGQMEQYYYAVQNGYSVTEEELKICMDEQDNIIKEASNFAELEAYYEESGTTYDEYRQRTKEYSRLQFTIKKLYNVAYEEFRHGNDRIGERICEDFNEYWTYFLLDFVYPAAETYNEETLIPLLDEAEEFYNECLGIGTE